MTTFGKPPAPLTHEDFGIIRQAMAYRVKYRRWFKEPGSKKDTRFLNISVRQLVVSRANRGGAYPNEETVRNLGIWIADNGFSQDEADHNGVCVEEVPEAQRPEGEKQSMLQYNREKVAGTKYLEGLFDDNDGMYGTLSHSHLTLTLLAWETGAKWKLTNERGESRFCDDKGCLDLSAVADVANLAEMLITLKEGLRMEVLGYKIVLEEPRACSIISQALNKGHESCLLYTSPSPRDRG